MGFGCRVLGLGLWVYRVLGFGLTTSGSPKEEPGEDGRDADEKDDAAKNDPAKETTTTPTMTTLARNLCCNLLRKGCLDW